MPPKPKYVKKDHIEHVLTRADMYIGSIRNRKTQDYVALEVENGEYRIIKDDIDINPGLLRIFVEALSNAIDNVKRSETTATKCTKIKVNIDKDTGETIIWNDGQVVPIEVNDEGDYNHTMIFGQLMTSSNYDDDEERLVSGRNGIGIKATNIYSKSFQVRGFDPDVSKIFEQTWKNNMRDISKPKLTSHKAKHGFTEIKYVPDFERFGMKFYTDDTINLYRKYVCDAAMLTKISVYFNENLIPVKNLAEYSKLYNEEQTSEVSSIKTDTADVVITPSNGEYEAISFVNGVYTFDGGKHVDSWSESIFRPLVQKFNKPKKPQINITDIKKFFRIFVNVSVVNPEFSSQSKTCLVSPEVASDVPLKNINAIMKWNFVEQIEEIIRGKEFLALKKTEKKTRGFKKIEGLDHANNAGTKLSKDCTLILTEGLSAKTYAVTGIQEGWNGFKGRDFFGVFGLRGKVLNTRNAVISAIAKNKEITDVIQALGVRYGVDYKDDKNFETLNYGRLMILADADCFTHDTPVVIRKNNIIDIVSMEKLGDKQWIDDTNICIDTEVWSDNGWTRIEGLRRLYTTKKVIQINTHCGIIRCTEDHKMLLENGREILAKDIKIGDNLMRTQTYLNSTICSSINKNDAFIMGLNFSNDKIVHTSILNGSIEIKQSFFDGIMNNLKFDEITVNGQLGAQGIYYIASLLGYNVNIIEKINNTNIFTVNISSYNKYNKNAVYDIKEIEYRDKYVYDLQTENHHLNAGVGGIVVHNCDGIHIKGLILNFIHSLFPSLLERDQPFVVSMQTPIVKVFLKTKSILFYDQQKFKEYSEENSDKKLTVKYYKGLGTSSDSEVLETFGKRVVELLNDKDALVNMNKVFHKSHADDRKVWIGNYNPNADLGIEIDESPITQVNITDFIDKEMIKFSISDCARSIPNMMDGFKESHRKTLYACFLKKLNYGGQTLKVAQLAGFVAEKTNYHHGEQNLFDTITKMAHDFPGSNNIPLLFRDGQFGSRNSLGKDAANARYIFTKLDILTRLIFRPEDDCLLERVVDDGDIVEPKFYVPIIPMVLVNGVIAGIGTGWSCNVPSYNPLDIIECIKIWLKNRTVFEQSDKDNVTKISLLPELKPWYRGFEGKIEKDSDKKYTTYGRIVKEGQGKDKVLVDELPISMSIDKFKEYLEEQLETKNIKSMKNYSTPTKVKFIITESNDGIKCNEENLKLKSYIYTSNMVLFTEKEQLNKFETVDDIIESFCIVRYEYYIKRKEYILKELNKELKTSQNKARFLREVMNDELIIFKRDEADISKEMETKGYDKEEDSFDYLLRLQVRSFTRQKIEDLETEIENTKKQIKTIQTTSETQMWINDLDTFTKAYNIWLKSTEKTEKSTKSKK
jgi:DNA gyrase/topoisomerase IV subunit B